MKKRFELPEFDRMEKELLLRTAGIMLSIDFDDVNHWAVEELVKLIVPQLNRIPEKEWQAAIERGNEAMRKEYGDD
jgi:hypothetical protein